MKFRNVALAFSCLGIPCVPGSAADVKVLAGDPSTVSRTVTYHETDIIPISTEIRFTTLIELPKEESILEVTCGDKEYWPVNWTGNLAYVKPAKPGGRTNLNLIAASGNVYSFLAAEVSQDPNGHADLKIFGAPSDASALVAMKGNRGSFQRSPSRSTRSRRRKRRRSSRPSRLQLASNWRKNARRFAVHIRTRSGTTTRSPLARRTRSM